MKLTEYQRDAIVRAIFQDVPVAKSEDIQTAVQKDLVKAMSPACQKAYKACPEAIKTGHSYDITFERDNLVFAVGDANFAEVIAPWLAARKNYSDAKNALRSAVGGCSTLKQLNDLLPEFAAYFPVEGQPTKNLPAVANLVANIVKLGWKGQS